MDNRDPNTADGIGVVVAKTIGLFIAWLGTLGLADLQVMVGIFSGLVFAGYTFAQWRALARREKAAILLEQEAAQNRRDAAQDCRDEARDHRNH